MTDHKFTDDDVIKALECCSKDVPILNSCEGCPFAGKKCAAFLPQTALDLINRQKAEIERLIKANNRDDLQHKYCNLIGDVLVYSKSLEDYNKFRKSFKAEAIKEFANNVVQELWKLNWHYGQIPCSEEDKTIQRAIKECIAVVERNTKEMTEENK